MTTTTVATAIVHKRITETSSVKRIIYGIIELVLAGLILFVFALKVPAENVTKFVMTPGGITIGKAGDWIIPTQLTLYILVALSVVLAVIQIVRGFGKGTNIILGLGSGFLYLQFPYLAGIRQVFEPGRDAFKCSIAFGSHHPWCLFRRFMRKVGCDQHRH